MIDDLEFEKQYWNTCVNTFDEDQKHYVYARYMQLKNYGYSFDVNNKSILDIGGGPTSILLKCINLKKGKVVDPIDYPQWTKDRYAIHNVDVEVNSGENINEKGWDEVWIYNCLQHVEDPEKIINNGLKAGKVLRLFEWVNIPPHPGHPHELTSSFFYNILRDIAHIKTASVVTLSESGCYGTAFYGTFESLIYEQN
jgi:hypothetical protein